MAAEASVSQEIRRRMQQYLLFRLLVTALGFLLVTFYLSFQVPEAQEATAVYLYALLTAYLGLGIASRVTFSSWKNNARWYRHQVLIDFGIQGLLVWSTGGVVSIFSPILFVTLAGATGVASPRGSNLLATVATVFLAGTTVAYALGLVPATSAWSSWIFSGGNSVFVGAYLIANILGLYAISALGSRLSRGLRTAEDLQAEIIESMAEGLLAVDEGGRIVHLNGEARKLMGLEGDEESYRLRTLEEVLASRAERDETDCKSLHRLREAFASPGRRRFEAVFRGAEGRDRPVEVKISSVTDDKMRLRCRVGLFSDLSLKREIESAERRIQRLEELQIMAMGIAHEIRNPLASIRGCVQEISRSANAESGGDRFAGIVVRESDRLDRIIEDFLGFARTAPSDLVPLNLVDVVREVEDLLRQRAGAREDAVELRCEERRIRVYGDRDRLVQVFLNLGINALQATAQTGGRVRLEVVTGADVYIDSRGWSTEDRSVGGAEVRIQDEGPGIAEEDLERVFTPFFTTKSGGSGLGLSVVERIVREHLGTVSIESGRDGGTLVHVRLPVLSEEGGPGGDDDPGVAGAPACAGVPLHG